MSSLFHVKSVQTHLEVFMEEASDLGLVCLSQQLLCAPEFLGQQEAQTAFSNEIRRRIVEFETLPIPPDTESRMIGDARGRELGALIGGLEIGFRRAQDEAQAGQAMEKMLIGVAVHSASNLCPYDITIPGVGSLKGMSADLVTDKIFDWTKEKEPTADELVRPFYQFALQIPADFSDEMESIAGRFHDNELLGFLNN